MNFSLRIFGSSSSGNCALLRTPRCRVLIDAGLGIRCLRKLLGECGLQLGDIDAVFLTHDHGDHTRALQSFGKDGAHIAVFANQGTRDAVARQTRATLNWRLFESGQSWTFGDLEVRSFRVPHDGADAVGYVFSCGGRKLGWVSDVGHITDAIRNAVGDVHCLALESNYEYEHLVHSNRPYLTQRRIDGPHGHLSNADAFDFLQTTPLPECARVCFIHVSRECNTRDELLSRYRDTLFKPAYALEVADPFFVGVRPEWEI